MYGVDVIDPVTFEASFIRRVKVVPKQTRRQADVRGGERHDTLAILNVR